MTGVASRPRGRPKSASAPADEAPRDAFAVLVAAERDPNATVFWHLDGDYLGSTRGDNRMELRAAPGPHLLTLVDEAGREVSRRFTLLTRDQGQ